MNEKFSLLEKQATYYLDQRVRSLDVTAKTSYIERGLILREMKRRFPWDDLTDPTTDAPYTSFDRWVLSAAPYSYRDCYAAMAAAEELRDIDSEKLAGIPRCNIVVMQSLSTEVRNRPETLQAAAAQSEREFISTIQRTAPEQHLEHRATKQDEAIEIAMAIEGTSSRKTALDAVFDWYIAEHVADYEKMRGIPA
ncbi:MAG TPA: hypothetical protein VGK96_28350 [Candidatus Sulfotelmatobacter sp.]|jgi:hypothetical protein